MSLMSIINYGSSLILGNCFLSGIGSWDIEGLIRNSTGLYCSHVDIKFA